ncbi:Crp/Fnr family transcriptional regulator [Crossiella cryophila]|uniref:CRP-like cAMP-binding protein n=1 Tax=Crossiella cryophila TaxID=43355 RepID=A0A7W7CII8_9PSEU|nr:Crp/Fnr family transcriptional regulator [Crossiella cryophila]MBB4681821.1 CRP-like cAMP-binding protein [Crossiella cryophila]
MDTPGSFVFAARPPLTKPWLAGETMHDNNNPTEPGGHPALGGSCLLRGLPAKQAQSLADELTRTRFLPGIVIHREGDPRADLHVLCDGKVKISQTTGGDVQQLKVVAGPGDLLGDEPYLTPGVHTTTATAATLVTVARISCAALADWAGREPAIGREIQRDHDAAMVAAGQRLADRVSLSATGRLAKLFLLLAHRFGTADNGTVRLKHHLDHTELGDLIGASRQAVHGALAELTRLGLLSTRRRGVVLLDPEALARRIR